MRFRRRSFSGGAKRPHEPVMFDRRNISFVDPPGAGLGIFGATVGPVATLFDPTNVIAGMQDLRLTLRRLRFSFGAVVTVTGATLVTGDVISLYWGVALCKAGEANDPSCAGTTGQRADWLWLETQALIFGGNSPQSFTVGGLRNVENQNGLIDIKAQRKVDQDQVVALYAIISNGNHEGQAASDTGSTHTATAAVINGSILTSAVYSRTMKR